jgi:hypothetical protein
MIVATTKYAKILRDLMMRCEPLKHLEKNIKFDEEIKTPAMISYIGLHMGRAVRRFCESVVARIRGYAEKRACS